MFAMTSMFSEQNFVSLFSVSFGSSKTFRRYNFVEERNLESKVHMGAARVERSVIQILRI